MLAVLYTSDETLFDNAQQKYEQSVVIEEEPPKEEPLIYARVTPNGEKNIRRWIR